MAKKRPEFHVHTVGEAIEALKQFVPATRLVVYNNEYAHLSDHAEGVILHNAQYYEMVEYNERIMDDEEKRMRGPVVVITF